MIQTNKFSKQLVTSKAKCGIKKALSSGFVVLTT
eukprot:COSAG04_NODE_43_length_31842_cov_15.704848_14_plen_34_part_00